MSILRVDSSMRQHGSVSRDLADLAVARLRAELADAEVVWRDLKSGVGHVNSAWRDASLGPAAARSAEERALLAQSDALTSEVERADILVFAVPIYNFGIPAALKAWVDMVCRDNVDGATAIGKTDANRYKHAIVIMTSNHTLAGADDEFASGFMQFILKFIGCTEIHIVDATGLANDKQGILRAAKDRIDAICQTVATHNLSAAAE
ncbi:NAD(P)H-dependent oxidoreductase [Candidatus Puniceispirillum sp.]|nr:NAD(P)H-dependent oxidoreductase [Candidatus Puniceispirillum sp.]